MLDRFRSAAYRAAQSPTVQQGVDDAVQVVDDLAARGTRVVNVASKQLQSKFAHAADFAVKGSWGPENAAKFEQAIQSHVGAAGTQAIEGTYRGTQAVMHHFNPGTGLNVITTKAGDFISGWRLSADQVKHLLEHGNVQ